MDSSTFILKSAVLFVILFCSISASDGDLGVTRFSQASAYYGDSYDSRHRRTESSDQNTASDMTLKSFNVARAIAFDIVNLIYQRFEFSTPRVQFLLTAANVPTTAWDIMKYKIAKKFIDGNSTLLFIFGGSSVTAGHDNYYNESYPSVFERRMEGVFRALNIDFQVHNIAHGTNKCRPSDLCYEAMGGYNADWLGWEQSFDCGRDRGIFELMARTAYWNRAVLYFSASGGFSPGHCPPSNDTVPWISEQWTPALEPSLKDKGYAPNSTEVAAFKERSNAFYEDGNSIARFSEGLTEKYKGTAPHGFSVWSGSKTVCDNDIKGGKGCGSLEIMGDCMGAKNGNHWMTKEASTYAVGRGAPHHPPAGIHLQRGEFLAYNYLHIVLDAINMAEQDMRNMTNAEISTAYQTELDRLQPQVLPEAQHCSPECASRAVCYTSFLPNWNPSHLLESVIVGNMDPADSNTWKYKNMGSRDERMGYKDIKALYETSTENATIHVKVTVNEAKYLRVCGYSAKESMKHVRFQLDINATSVDANYAPSSSSVPWLRRKYAGDECTLLSDLPQGNHVLSLICALEGRMCTFTHLVLYE